jgi:hypothetical protein
MTISERPFLSDRAERLARALKDCPRRRVPLEQLWQLLDTTDPSTRTFLHRRQLLADALNELAAAEAIQLPSQRSYDRSEHPPLPKFVILPGVSRPEESPIQTVWHPTLSWAADASVSAGQRPILEKINRWLFTNNSDLIIPLSERSLEILGDEKAFDRLQTTSLFSPDRLTLDLLHARRVAPPMYIKEVGDGRTLLVVENSDTFDSLCTVLAAAPGNVGVVGWGAGGAFEASVLSVGTMADRIDDIAYFGDLDVKGLQVPANADRLATATGLPHIRPAVGLYTALEMSKHHQPGQPRADTPAATALTEWLDPRHRAWASNLLRSGTRIAQESVGLTWLTKHGEWRIDLD